MNNDILKKYYALDSEYTIINEENISKLIEIYKTKSIGLYKTVYGMLFSDKEYLIEKTKSQPSIILKPERFHHTLDKYYFKPNFGYEKFGEYISLWDIFNSYKESLLQLSFPDDSVEEIKELANSVLPDKSNSNYVNFMFMNNSSYNNNGDKIVDILNGNFNIFTETDIYEFLYEFAIMHLLYMERKFKEYVKTSFNYSNFQVYVDFSSSEEKSHYINNLNEIKEIEEKFFLNLENFTDEEIFKDFLNDISEYMTTTLGTTKFKEGLYLIYKSMNIENSVLENFLEKYYISAIDFQQLYKEIKVKVLTSGKFKK